MNEMKNGRRENFRRSLVMSEFGRLGPDERGQN